jgi:hypothetical protein
VIVPVVVIVLVRVVALVAVVTSIRVVVLVEIDVVTLPYSMNVQEAKITVKMTKTPSNTFLVFNTHQESVEIGTIYIYCKEQVLYGLRCDY